MAGFTDAYELTVLDSVFNGSGTVQNSAVWVAYGSGTSTESTDANYARQRIWGMAPSAGAWTSSAAVTFPAVAATDSVAVCSLWTASGQGAGTQITDWKALTGGTVSLSAGQQFRIPAGDYDLTLD